MKNKNINPTQKDAKKVSNKYHKDGVIIFHFEGRHFGYASYGKDKNYCIEMRILAEKLFNYLAEDK